MAVEFTMPKLGLTMTDGTIREWLVAEGTMVQAGDPVLVIETDKVETEVEARETGVLSITGVVGENYECGAVIGQLLADGETASAGPAPAAAAVAAPAPAPAAAAAVPPAAVPPANQAPAAATAVGSELTDIAARGEGGRILASPMARAAARDLGIDLRHIAGTGPNGRIVADDVAIFAAAPPAVALAGVAPASTTDVATRGEDGRVLASPMARAAARDLGIDLSRIAGTGPNGRIVADDVAAYAAAPPTPAPVAAPAAAAVPANVASGAGIAATGGARMLAELLGLDLRMVPAASPGARVTREDVAAWVRQQLASSNGSAHMAPSAQSEPATAAPLLQEPSKLVPLRGMRGVIAERMHTSLQEMAQLTLSVDVNMTAVSAERARLRQEDNVVPGYTAWVIAAASRALVDHPCANSQVTPNGVAHLPEIHLGVAVALDDGLIVPVIHNANTRPVEDLHEAVADLAGRARQGKLALSELEGGTFSVTALGMFGVDMFTPVINPPNSAILGVGRLRTDTQWNDGEPSPVTVMTLSLTWDHRAFDGAPAAEFAQSIVQYLEDPRQLL